MKFTEPIKILREELKDINGYIDTWIFIRDEEELQKETHRAKIFKQAIKILQKEGEKW